MAEAQKIICPNCKTEISVDKEIRQQANFMAILTAWSSLLKIQALELEYISHS